MRAAGQALPRGSSMARQQDLVTRYTLRRLLFAELLFLRLSARAQTSTDNVVVLAGNFTRQTDHLLGREGEFDRFGQARNAPPCPWP